jgi:hypothetical protein
MNTVNSRRVALVLDPDFGEECFGLANRMPIWVVDSVTNRAAVDAIRKAERGDDFEPTTFPTRGGKSLTAMCERIVQSLDDHYNERSHSPGYAELDIIGVQLDEVYIPIFHELGFSVFSRTQNGFIAKKVEREN